MAQQGELRIPVALRPTAAQVITLTDRVCANLLDEEYAALARHVVAKLARKRHSSLSGSAIRIRTSVPASAFRRMMPMDCA